MAEQNAIPLDFDLGSVEAWDGTKGGFDDLPAGAYKGVTKSAGSHTGKSSGKESFAVEVETDVGTTTIYLGLDFSKEPNKRKLHTALRSVGIAADKLSKVKGLTPGLFMGSDGKGRPCYIVVKEVTGTDAQGRKKLNDKEFLTPEQFAAYAQSNGAAAPGAGAAAPGKAGGSVEENLFG